VIGGKPRFEAEAFELPLLAESCHPVGAKDSNGPKHVMVTVERRAIARP
jgi:hypothetical protein